MLSDIRMQHCRCILDSLQVFVFFQISLLYYDKVTGSSGRLQTHYLSKDDPEHSYAPLCSLQTLLLGVHNILFSKHP